MKNTRQSRIRPSILATSAAALIALCMMPAPAKAQQFWDVNGVGAGLGGTGNWDLATSNWGPVGGLGPVALWANTATSDAVFQGVAGVINQTVALTVRNMTFNVSGYELSGNFSVLTLAPGSTITVTNAGDTARISTATGGVSGFTKAGLGTLEFFGTGVNGYTGTTAVNDGILNLNKIIADQTIPGNLTIGDGVGAAGSAVVGMLQSNQIANASAITINSDGQFNIGATTDTIGSLAGAGGVNLGTGLLTTGANNSSTSYAGTFTGTTGGLTKTGTGTWTLTGGAGNAYTGAFTVADGTVQLNQTPTSNSATGQGALNIGDGAGAAGSAVLQLLQGTQINNQVAVTILADGRFDLNGQGEQVGSVAGVAGSSITLGAVGLLTTGTNNTSTAFNGVISGGGSISKVGAGTWTLGGLNTYTGNTLVGGGVLQAGVATQAFGIGSAVSVDAGAVLDLNGFNNTIGSLSGVAGSFVTNNNVTPAVLTVGDATSTTFSGIIQSPLGALGLTKVGTGTLTLAGVNTYTGATIINNGIIDLVASAGLTGLGSPGVGTTVNVGATLRLQNGATTGLEPLNLNGAGFGGIGALAVVPGGTGTVGGPVSFAGNTTIISGLGSTLIFNGTINKTDVNVTFTGGGIVTANGAITGNAVGYNDDLIVDGVTFNLNAANSYVGNTFIRSTGGLTGTLNANVLNGLPNSTDPNINNRTAVTMNDVGTGQTVLNIANGVNQSAQILKTTVAANVNPNATVNLSGGSTLTVGNITANPNGQGDATFAGVITGPGGLTKDGTNRQILTGINTYLGFTTINGGVLQVGDGTTLNSQLGQSLVFLNVGNLDINLANSTATPPTNNGVFNNTVFTLVGTTVRAIHGPAGEFNTIAGPILGTGGLEQNGLGTTILTNTNLYTGPTTVNAGILRIGNGVGGSIASGSLVTVNTAGILESNLASNTTLGNNITLTGAGKLNFIQPGITTASGVITGAATSFINQNGILGRTIVTGNSGASFLGLTTINAGTLQIGDGTTVGSALGSAATPPIIVNATGALAVNLANTGTLTNNVIVNAGGLVTGLAGAGKTNSLSGNITGAGGVSHDGAGTTILLGNGNTYTGATTINAGTLQVGILGDAGTIGTATISVGTGGTFSVVNLLASPLANNITNGLGGTGLVNIASPTALTLSGILSDGAVGQLALTQSGAGVTTLTGANTYTGATTVAAGTLQVGNGTIGSISNTSLVTVNPGATLGINLVTGGTFGNTVINNGLVQGTNAGANIQTISGLITGLGSFTQGTGVAGGRTILTNNNSYTGGTTVNGAGTVLQIGTAALAGAAGTNTININGGSTLELQNVNGNVLSNNMTNTAGGTTGTVLANSALTTTLAGSLTNGAGTLLLTQSGAGTTILSNTGNTYTGQTTVSAGILQVGTNAQAGSIGGLSPIKVGTGGTLSIVNITANTLSNGVTNTLGGVGTLNVNSFLNNTLSGDLTDGAPGTLALTQTGIGTTFLTSNVNTFTGGTTISAGTLQVGSAAAGGGASGSVGTGAIVNNSNLAINRSNAFTLTNAVSGIGNLTQIGTGTTTLTGVNTYTGTTLISAGALQVGNAGVTGQLGTGAVTDNASLIFNRTDAITVANAIGGTGSLTQQGTGITNLTGASTYTGATNVNFGTLRVNGSLGNTAVTVASGATLGGGGSIAGAVTILNGGNLAPGNSPGTLTVGSLFLNNASISTYELFTPGVVGSLVNDLVNVTGNLTLDGQLTVVPNPTVSAGSYRLFNYGGVLTDNIMSPITGVPAGFNPTIVTGVAGQVNLLLLNAALVGAPQFWDGGAGALVNDAVITGGTGNWDNFQNNWTNAAGTVNSSWANGPAVFAAPGGTVTLINNINAQGLAFTANGYVINSLGGFTLNLVGPAPAPTITVSAGLTATINAQIIGTNGLTADGAGTLVLNNAGNTFTGGVTVNGAGTGTLSISNDGSLGAAANTVTLTNGTLQATATFASARNITLTGIGTIDVMAPSIFTESGIISGAALSKTGTGTLNLTGVNTYVGGTTIQNGTLQVTNNGNLGNVAGGITFGGTAGNNPILQTLAGIVSARGVTLNASGGTFDTNGFTSTLSGVIAGAAGNNFTKIGAGTLIATGASTYLGTTNVNAGTLQVGDGATLGSQIGNNTATVIVNNTAILDIKLGASGIFGNTVTVNAGGSVNATSGGTQTISNVISGAGVLNQNGAGTTIITAANTFTGATNVNAGTLQIASGGNLSAASQVNVAGVGILDVKLGGGQTLNSSNIANAGTINATNTAGIQTISAAITGVGTFNQTGAGTTSLTGASTYTGATNVNAGILRVNGSLGNTIVTVASGATLGGAGTIAGNVTILSGGIIAPGNSAGTLTVGNLVLNSGSNSNYELATPGVIGSGVNDLVNVTSNLTLDGTLNLTAVAPPFGSGSYRLYNYGGVLTNNVLDVNGATVPAGFNATVVTGVLHEVNLLVLANGAGPAQLWDGPHANNTSAEGGTGNWDNFNNNWTDLAGINNAAWQNGTAIFGAAAGTVTIVAPINAQGLNFTTSGYVINGSGGFGLSLVSPVPAANATINVLAGGTATINAQISTGLTLGASGLTANGAGTLVLTNVGNNYVGGTTITGGGTVSISSDANLGASGAGNGITFNGGTLQATSTFTLATARAIILTGAGTIDVTDSNTLTYGGLISGAGVGGLSKTGTGTLNLNNAAANTYTGGTSILGGILQIANDNNLGTGGLTFANNATLETLAGIVSARTVLLNAGGGTIDTDGFNSTFSGVISGVGSLTKIDTGTLTLTAVETFTGPLNVNGGTVQIGNGITGNLAAASVVNVNNGGTFAVNLGAGVTLATASIVNNLGGTVTGINAAGFQIISGVVSGAGTLNQNGLGTTILSGANTYTGATTVLVGTLQLGGTNTTTAGATATGSLNPLSTIAISGGATLAFNRNNALTQGVDFNSVISGAGGVNQLGTGTTLLNGANIYTGPTLVSAGTLQVGDGITGFINVASAVTVLAPGTLALRLANGGNFGNTIANAGTINELVTLGNTNTVSGPISGIGTFNQNGTGITILNGNNTYTGLTTVNAGEIQVGSNTALGGIGALAATNVVAGGTVRLLNGITVAGETLNLNGFGTAGSGALAGTAGGTATFGGPVFIITNSSINANGGTLNLTGGITKNGTVLTLNGGAGGVINISGTGISGVTNFTSDLVVDGIVVNENVANSYAGPTFITNGGTLNANVLNALPTAIVRTTVNMDPTVAIVGSPATFPSTGSSKLVLGVSQAIQSIAGTNATSSVNLNANTLSIGTAAATTTSFSGVISGTGAILKDVGASTQILAGNNTYTGTTTVNAGVLQAGFLKTAFGVNSATTVGAFGTLELANFSETIDSLAGAGAVKNSVATGPGAAVLTLAGTAGAASVFSGIISDTAGTPLALVLNDGSIGGTASQTLSGQSTYRGLIGLDPANPLAVTGTVLNAGTLNINASSLLASGVNPPVSGPIGVGVLAINGGTIGTTSAGLTNNDVSNRVQINSSFNVTGNAVNVVGGPVLSNGVTFSGPVNLGTTATITTTSGFLDLTGVISGGGNGVTFNGNTFSLIGAGGLGDAPNTYTGLTTVNGGLVLLNKGAAVAGANGLAIPGNLTINAGGLVQTFSNFLGGAGNSANNQIAPTANVVVNGGLDLGGTNQAINNLTGTGTVQLSDGPVNAAFGPAAATTAGGLTVNSGNFAGVIADAGLGGQLVKVTPGTLVLTGKNTFVGTTFVNQGSLIVNGSIASANTIVNALGLLGGNGFVKGNLINHGIVSPGNSPGTLTVGGNYFQTGGGTLFIEVAGKLKGQADLLAVGGAANLGGTVRIVNTGNVRLKRNDVITFLTAGAGVNGRFTTESLDSFLPSGHLLTAGVVYHSNRVDLAAIQGSFVHDIGGLTPNQKAVARALDGAINDRRLNKLIKFLDGESLGNLRHDLDLIAPEELTSIFNLGVSLSNVQTANLQRRMDDLQNGTSGFSASGYAMNAGGPSYSGGAGYGNGGASYGARGPEGKGGKELRAPEDNRWGVFVTGVGEFTNIGNTSNARGFDMTTGGFTVGVDYKVTPNFAIGLNTGFARSGVELSGNGHVNVDGGKLGLYATYFNGTGFYADAAVNGGYNSYDTRRSALRGSAHGETNGAEFNALFATGYDWKTGGLSIGPTANVQYTNVQINSFRERGSLAPLKFNDQSEESLRTALGMKASYDVHAGNVVIRPEVRVAWQHEFGNSSYALDSRFANGAGSTFTVRGPEIGDDSLLIGAGMAVLWNERTSTYVYYDGEVFRSNYSSNNVSGGVRLSF